MFRFLVGILALIFVILSLSSLVAVFTILVLDMMGNDIIMNINTGLFVFMCLFAISGGVILSSFLKEVLGD